MRVSSGFLLLCSWLFYRDRDGILLQGLLACALHETGHYLMLLLLGSNIKGIYITVFGAKMEFGNELSYPEEAAAAVAGPLVNLVLAVCCSGFPKLYSFAGVNLALGVFNLLPVGTLDGARIMGCVTAQLQNERFAYRINRCVTIAFTVFFGAMGMVAAIVGGNLTLLIMCLWLIFGGQSEIMTNFNKKEWK